MPVSCLKLQVISFLIIVLFWSLQVQTGVCAPLPKPGESLVEISMAAPVMEKDTRYLNIESKGRFSIQDIDAPLIVLEIIGVYCPLCHKQRPHINRLFHRMNRSADLARKIKFLGISVGATPMEVAYYVKKSRAPYPVLPDEKYNIHKKLGQPRTPFNMVVTRDGQILYTHLGAIEDMDAFFTLLKKFASKVPPVNN